MLYSENWRAARGATNPIPAVGDSLPMWDASAGVVGYLTTSDLVGGDDARLRYLTVPINTAVTALGTNTTMVSGTIYWAEVRVLHCKTLTGVGVLNGATVGTNNGLVALYNTAGVLVANSALAGTLTAGANVFQDRAFTSTYAARPGRYFIAYQTNGTTDTLRTIAASQVFDVLTASATGTFGTLTALTVPTTFTADKGPYAYVY